MNFNGIPSKPIASEEIENIEFATSNSLQGVKVKPLELEGGIEGCVESRVKFSPKKVFISSLE